MFELYIGFKMVCKADNREDLLDEYYRALQRGLVAYIRKV